jgi:membrane fusion protein, hemolysin D
MRSARGLVTRLAGARSLARPEELAFLPAALEIVETPPSPIGRAISFTISAAFCVALAWASVGTLDIVAVAPGKIVSSGRTKVIQPFEIGVVRAIRVQDGQTVKAGDVLIELDPTINDAERAHLQSDLMSAQLDVARLRATIDDNDPLAAFHPPDGAPPELVATQRQLLVNQIQEQHDKLAALDRQRAQKEAERASYGATIAKLQATIPILEQRVEIRRYLTKREYGSKLTYLDTLNDLVSQQKELAVQESHLTQAQAGLDAITATKAQTESEFRRTRLGELATAEQKAAGSAQDVIKATERSKLQILTAPVEGVVQQLAVHTVGGVVTPAQPLLVIVPLDSPIEIEAMVSNRDIGFVHAGQEAAIKVDTFNFTKYGLLRGEVLDVSADSIPRKPSDPSPASAQPADGDLKAPELVYIAHVSLDQTQMDVDGKTVHLSPGLTVTAEIKTGSRRVITYLLSPLLKYKQESLRER